MAGHPVFTPNQPEAILDFFQHYNYAVVSDTFTADQIGFLTAFVEGSKRAIPAEWGPDRLGVYSHGQILVHHPQLDPYIQPATTFPLVEAIMGPDVRFAQYDFRHVPAGRGDEEMRYHKDRAYAPAKSPRAQAPFDCNYVCAIHYLSDVAQNDPCFCVVPNSHPYTSLEEAQEKMGPDYKPVPIRGPAGTAILYNISIFHTRIPGDRPTSRLTQHNYYSKATSPPLTNWVLIPRRLAHHPDPTLRTYFSQWPEATQTFAERGFSTAFYRESVHKKPT